MAPLTDVDCGSATIEFYMVDGSSLNPAIFDLTSVANELITLESIDQTTAGPYNILFKA